MRWAGLRLAGLLAGVLAAAGIFAAARAQQPLVADLSNHLIAITTGFTGAEVVLFGATGGDGDVAVVVTGPRGPVTVRRKDRVAGVWLNTQSVVFTQVPSFYAVATSRPMEDFLSPLLLERHEVGAGRLRLEPAADLPPAQVEAFRDALVRNKRAEGLYAMEAGDVTFLGERLFRTNLYFPANVPTGLYTVEAFLIRDGEVVSAQTTPLVVSKVGFSAEVFEFARGQPFAYGVAAVAGALAAGWLAGAIFRKV